MRSVRSSLVICTTATVLGAALVCILKEDTTLLTALLFSLLFARVIYGLLKTRDAGHALRHGFVIATTATIGFLTESWGTANGHWTYHFLGGAERVPMWVPLAWAIAGELLALAERAIGRLGLSERQRLLWTFSLGMALPLLGESICIANGVWTYHWPVKIAGVPLLALILISYAHQAFAMIRGSAMSRCRLHERPQCNECMTH